MIYKYNTKLYKLKSKLIKKHENETLEDLDIRIMEYCGLSANDNIYKNEKYESISTMLTLTNDQFECEHSFAIVSCDNLFNQGYQFPVVLQFSDSYYLPCNYISLSYKSGEAKAFCYQDNKIWHIYGSLAEKPHYKLFNNVDELIDSIIR